MRRAAFFVLVVLSASAAPAGSAPQEGAAPTRFAVGLDLPPTSRAGEHFHGAAVVASDPALRFLVVETGQPADFRARAARDAGVRYVEADPERDLLALLPNDPYLAEQYGPQDVGAPSAWDHGLGTTDASVCVVDTGVRFTHQEFAGRWRGGIDLHNDDPDPSDDHGHGTHVAGTAAAGVDDALGIAGVGNVALYGVKVLSDTGSGYLSTVASGIRWCSDHAGPRTVISLSLGSPTTQTVLGDALRYAASKGALVVAAAGNSGPCADCVSYPAAYPEAVAVTCTDRAQAHCGFSSEGPQADLAAPGDAILSTLPGSDAAYGLMSGTSMSTPHVSGVAALVWSQAPGLDATQLRAALEGTAADLGPAGWDARFGHGLVDAKAALDRALGDPRLPPPPSPADLVVTRMDLRIVGGLATATATVTNRGTGDAGPFAVRFVADGALVLGDADHDLPLAPGAVATFTSPAWTVPKGNHTLQALVDPLAQVAESSDGNNEGRVTFSHQASTFASSSAPAKPDLALRYVFVAYADGRATYGAAVVNEGKASTGSPSVLRFRVDGAMVQDTQVPLIPAGTSTVLTGPPRAVAEGPHVVRALADARNQVAESDEKDNARDVAFRV